MAKDMQRQNDESKQIIKEPEGFDDIKKKFEEREAQQLKKTLAKRKVDSVEELQEFELKAIVNRSLRIDHKTLKDQEKIILREPKSPEIAGLRKQLEKETHDLAQETLRRASTLPPEEAEVIRKTLKGRVKGPPGSAPAT